MIKFPAPKVPATQFKGATRSKAARRVAELRKKSFLASASKGNVAAVTAAMTPAPRAVVEVDGQQLGISRADGHLADGTEIEHKTAVALPAYRRVNLGSVSEGQTASVDADGVVTRANEA